MSRKRKLEKKGSVYLPPLTEDQKTEWVRRVEVNEFCQIVELLFKRKRISQDSYDSVVSIYSRVNLINLPWSYRNILAGLMRVVHRDAFTCLANLSPKFAMGCYGRYGSTKDERTLLIPQTGTQQHPYDIGDVVSRTFDVMEEDFFYKLQPNLPHGAKKHFNA